MKQLYRKFAKRFFDTTVAVLLLILLAPVLLVTALVVRLKLGSPILFSQQRPGLNGKLFLMHKFRTMTSEKDSDGKLKSDEQRLTRFGKLLRSSSLDELPELWNVLRGQMSLVGPRPLLKQYLSLYNKQQSRRHEVRPGVTGWAQVNGRNAISWTDKFSFDVWYVDNLSFWLDFKILIKTVSKVLRSEDVNASGHATIEPFTGANEQTDRTLKLSVLRPEAPLRQKAISIIGAGGHAKVVAAAIIESGETVGSFYDDNSKLFGKLHFADTTIKPLEQIRDQKSGQAILAIGDNATRRKLAREFNFTWPCVKHPKAIIHDSVKLSEGTLVCAGAIIQPDVYVGSHSIINTGATVDHDSVISDFVHIGPGVNLAGGVVLEEGVLMGVGSCAAPGVVIGKNTIVGAGAVVINDLPPNSVAVGNPAQVIKSVRAA